MSDLIPILCLLLLAGGLFLAFRQLRARLPRIVCLGDSLTECGGPGARYADYLARALPGCEIIVRGVNGDTLSGGRARFAHDALGLHPVVLVLELGSNDFWARRPLDEMRTDLAWMLQAARGAGIEVVLAGVFGDQLDRAGRVIPKRHQPDAPADLGPLVFEMERALARRYGCRHVENIQADLNDPELWQDERHPNAAGNRLVAERLLPAVREALGAQGTLTGTFSGTEEGASR